MSSAYLHLVPDPDDERPPGEGPVLGPQPTPDTEPEDAQEETTDATEAEEAYEDEEPSPRAFAFPDLTPYYDVRPLKQLGPLAVTVVRRSQPPLKRALAHTARASCAGLVCLCQGLVCLCRGLRILLVLLLAWLSGRIGERGSIPARLGGAACVAYALATLPAQHPAAPYAMAAGFLLLVIAAGTGRISEPGTKKNGKKIGEKGKTSQKEKESEKGKGGVTRGKGDPTPALAAEENPGEGNSQPSGKTGFLDRLMGRANAPQPRTAVDFAKRAGTAGQPPGGTSGDDPSEAPAEPPLTALIRREIGADNGVHLADLRPAMRQALPGLSSASDKELRRVLKEAGWDPSRTFRARGRAGRAGVHRSQLPPLPSPGGIQEDPEDHSPGGEECPRPANSPGLSARAKSGEEWSDEDRARGYRVVSDPKYGPAYSRVEHHR
ncbi:hypothetical protein PH213_20485 [Streptomyces sp. SRF1]|uniref:hypothetical protein n=1 Tax=Streptomyces sp. SRF1 TaxID=1549642 RepID=UPI0025B004BE|nr:hypothetical protein [Streptomyces sp. SRF1]MDN3056885.1 hypothetical protein [Streptomyces sp. SRF1]